jgi:hypothetical protein
LYGILVLCGVDDFTINQYIGLEKSKRILPTWKINSSDLMAIGACFFACLVGILEGFKLGIVDTLLHCLYVRFDVVGNDESIIAGADDDDAVVIGICVDGVSVSVVCCIIASNRTDDGVVSTDTSVGVLWNFDLWLTSAIAESIDDATKDDTCGDDATEEFDDNDDAGDVGTDDIETGDFDWVNNRKSFGVLIGFCWDIDIKACAAYSTVLLVLLIDALSELLRRPRSVKLNCLFADSSGFRWLSRFWIIARSLL